MSNIKAITEIASKRSRLGTVLCQAFGPETNFEVLVLELTTLGFNIRDCIQIMYIASATAHLQINGIFNACRFYTVDVNPPVNSHSIPANNYIRFLLEMKSHLKNLVQRRIVRTCVAAKSTFKWLFLLMN